MLFAIINHYYTEAPFSFGEGPGMRPTKNPSVTTERFVYIVNQKII